MSRNALTTQSAGADDTGATHHGSLRTRLGSASLEAELTISTRGLLAVGGMVSSMLLSVAVVVWVSTRKLPEGTRPAGFRRG